MSLLAIALPLAAEAAPPRAEKPPQAPAPQQIRFDRRSPVVVAVERAKDAVVNMSSTRLVKVRHGPFDDELLERFFGWRDPFSRTVKTTSLGSGVVIHPSGYVLTNAHVVARATEVTCSFSEEKKLKAAIVSVDTAHDLAVLRIESAKPLPHLPMGRSDDLMIGETVVAIGNAMGYAHTVTTGVVSAVNRQIRLSKTLTLDHLIQTDASINPGNSGGPLLNINGELIGINTAIHGGAQNIGFAIAIDYARKELATLLDFARVNELQFGAALVERDGVRVESVAEKSPAGEGKLAAGDVILSVDGKPCRSLIDFNVLMLEKAAGVTVRLRVGRSDRSGTAREHVVKVQLLAMPKPDGNKLLWTRFGMRVRPVDRDLAGRLGLRPGLGLVITQMDGESQASQLGLQVGDVLVEAGKVAVNSLDALGQAMKKVRPGDVVRMGFLRGRFQVWTRLTAK